MLLFDIMLFVITSLLIVALIYSVKAFYFDRDDPDDDAHTQIK